MWVVDREVHVLDGAELSIADGTRILILNGVVPSSRIGRAALIFDSGSTLSAARFLFMPAVRSIASHASPTMAVFGF